MDTFPDIRTLFFIGAINAYICALMMIGSRRLHAASRASLLWAGATTATVGSAMALIALRGTLPDVVTVLVANSLGSIGALGVFQSFRLLCERPPRNAVMAAVAATLVCAHVALGSDLDNHAPRVAITCIMQGTCALLSVPMLLGRRGLDAPLPLNWSIGVMSAFGILNLMRLAAVVRHGLTVDGGGMLAGSAMQTAAITLYSLAPMAFALSFVGVVNARLAGDLRRLAITDSLTGLLTRRGFHDRATGMLERREGQTGVLALLMIDIDHFKHYNDALGHPAGDLRLRAVADALAGCIRRPGELLARYGGEEFAILLVDTSLEGAEAMAACCLERIRAAAWPHPRSPTAPHVTLSIGVASMVPPSDLAPDTLVAEADARLYQAKARGRDRWHPGDSGDPT